MTRAMARAPPLLSRYDSLLSPHWSFAPRLFLVISALSCLNHPCHDTRRYTHARRLGRRRSVPVLVHVHYVFPVGLSAAVQPIRGSCTFCFWEFLHGVQAQDTILALIGLLLYH